MKLVGVDVGGTFTDLVLADMETGSTVIHKVPSTPDDPSRGVMAGLIELCDRNGIPREAVDHVYHGTTIATNAVLEHRGAEAGMVTTSGFRDILHIGRHQRPQHYSIMQEIPWQERPLVRRRHRKVVTERLVPPRGEVLTPLDEEEVRQAARELAAAGVRSVAVCFLFSYLNAAHEERARDILLEEMPDAFVTTSAAVVPQFREFERFTTTAMNAFVGPGVRDYVGRLTGTLGEAGFAAGLRIMSSNGGLATPETIADFPVLTLLSGPAAGVLGGAWSGALSGRNNLITFDVGGTSADIGVVTDGRFAEASARDTWIAGYPVLVPMIDIHTIGAGGGSIARIDEGGAFAVGPRSAGSVPGPAAYGRGGTEPTVTDANVVLGRLDAANFLGGAMALDPEAARQAVHGIGEALGLTEAEAAEGIVTVINSNMANAIRSRTVQKGIDPRDYALVAFGGAGPLHGAEVAALLGIREVIVPPHPGITSAMGLLTTELKYDAVRTQFQTSADPDLDRLNAEFDDMRRGIAAQFAADGIAETAVAFERAADMRHAGQGYELRVPVPAGRLAPDALRAACDAFHRQHEAEYGHAFADAVIEIVNIRLSGAAETPQLGRPAERSGGSRTEALVREADGVFRSAGGLRLVRTAFYRRDLLPVGETLPGPAIVLQVDTTTVVPPDWSVTADRHGNLILRHGKDGGDA